MEDDEEWEKAVSLVKVLKNRDKYLLKESPEYIYIKKGFPEKDKNFDFKDFEDNDSDFLDPGFEKHIINNIKKKLLKAEDKFDMHGLTKEQQFKGFFAFIRESYFNKKRFILVITGKEKPAENFMDFKENLPKWINNPEIKKYISAYDYAGPGDGGKGAFYIMLKKKR